MADDVKGSFWPSAASGKPEAGDIRKRKKTLPLVWALQHAPEPDASRLREIYAARGGWPDVAAGSGRGAGHPGAQRRPRRGADPGTPLSRCGAADLEGLPINTERRAELRFLLESVIAT